MRTVVVLSCCIFALACGMTRQEQLEAVAKDWCMTIRASQIIPVYPLTEDVHPGDIFLVQTTIDRQQEIYAQRGFLPLDNHLARIRPSGYASFYAHSFLAGAPDAVLPVEWIRPEVGEDGTLIDEWGPAPNAAFPTYSFAVDQGAGLNLAVPISGIPVGLSLLGAETANGSVSIERARTMGVDTISLFRDLRQWALLHRDFLRAYAPAEGEAPRNYLRVLTRVYATGKLDVALSDAKSFSGGLDAGVPRPVELLTARAPNDLEDAGASSIENYTKNLAILNKSLAAPVSGAPEGGSPEPGAADLVAQAAGGMAPGGSLRVTAASSRFIALQQEFDPPLVIGYLGFDVQILEGGRIGPPIPTHARIDPKSQGEAVAPGQVVEALFSKGIRVRDYQTLTRTGRKGDKVARAAADRLDRLERFVPGTFEAYAQTAPDRVKVTVESFEGRNYLDFVTYRRVLGANEVVIGGLIASGATFQLETADGTRKVEPGSTEEARLKGKLGEWRKELAREDVLGAHREAAVFAGEAYVRLLIAGPEDPR